MRKYLFLLVMLSANYISGFTQTSFEANATPIILRGTIIVPEGATLFYLQKPTRKKNCKIQKEDLPFVIHNVHTRNTCHLHHLLIRPFILRIS